MGRVGLAASALLLTACASTQAPPEGEFQGEMCVTTVGQGVNCGPVSARLSGEVAQVQVSDIGYHLFLKKGQLDLVLMHGAMRIDSFTAAYRWRGALLQFSDPDKPVHYQIRFADQPGPGAYKLIAE